MRKLCRCLKYGQMTAGDEAHLNLSTAKHVPDGRASTEWKSQLRDKLIAVGPDSKMILVGVGHPFRGDDYVGSYIAKKLMVGNHVQNIQLFDAEQDVEAIIPKIQALKPKQIMFIDSCQMNLGPGEARVISIDDTDYPFFTTHSIPLKLLVNQFLPESQCWMLAIQPEQVEISDQLSSKVRNVADSIITLIGSTMEATA